MMMMMKKVTHLYRIGHGIVIGRVKVEEEIVVMCGNVRRRIHGVW